MTSFKAWTVISLSLVVCLLLQIMPLPMWAIWYRPEWIVLALIYWALVQPERVGVTIAFIMGLFMDLLTGTLLGQHALAYTVIIYFTLRFYPLLRQFPAWQQAVLIFFFMLLFETFQLWIWGIRGGRSFSWMYWLPCIMSALIWPWMYGIMKIYQKHYRLY